MYIGKQPERNEKKEKIMNSSQKGRKGGTEDGQG